MLVSISARNQSPSHDLVKTRPRLFQFLLHIKPSHQKISTTSSQSLSSALTVISANIESLSAVKASILSGLCKEQHCHCLCLQETHRCERKARPRIPGMTLVAERPYDKYGSAHHPHQTSVFHLSTHFLSVSLNLLRSSNEQGCARRVHCTMCAVFVHGLSNPLAKLSSRLRVDLCGISCSLLSHELHRITLGGN